MKAAQILATYFGKRRTYPYNVENTIEILRKQIENLKILDTGYDSDLIIVNHDSGNVDGHEFLKQVDGIKLKNGVVRILNRPIINHDMSFGSYKYAFYKHQNEYDFWFFNEDDILPMTSNFVGDMISMLESDTNTGFVAALQFTDAPVHHFRFDSNEYIIETGGSPAHAHGGVGMTSTKIIRDVHSKFPDYLNTPNINYGGESILENGGYGGEGVEVKFTHIFIEAGYKLKCYSDGTKFKRLQDGRNL
jgi:hypothetical protein